MDKGRRTRRERKGEITGYSWNFYGWHLNLLGVCVCVWEGGRAQRGRGGHGVSSATRLLASHTSLGFTCSNCQRLCFTALLLPSRQDRAASAKLFWRIKMSAAELYLFRDWIDDVIGHIGRNVWGLPSRPFPVLRFSRPYVRTKKLRLKLSGLFSSWDKINFSFVCWISLGFGAKCRQMWEDWKCC